MLSDYTQLLDRNYVIGYLTPAILFVTASAVTIANFFLNHNSSISVLDIRMQNGSIASSSIQNVVSLFGQVQNLWIKYVIVLVFMTWMISISLLVMNRELISVLEGYGFLGKTPLLTMELKHFEDLKSEIKSIKKKYDDEKIEQGGASATTTDKYIELMTKFSRRYPSESNDVLPTSFGNIIRAFEVYPYDVYGIDSIAVWTRIIQLVPKDKRESLNYSKANVDFAVNIFYSMLGLLLEYAILASLTRSIHIVEAPIIAIPLAYLAYKLAKTSAWEWGEDVKAVFDLYRRPLLSQMGFEIPQKCEEERNIWTEINRSFLYGKNLRNILKDEIGPNDENNQIIRGK